MILKKIRMHQTPLLRIWKIHIRCHRPRKRIEMMDQKKKNSTYRNNESHMERSLLRDHLIAEQMLHTSAWQYVSKTSQTCRRDTRWAPQCEKKEIIPSKKRPMSLRVRSAISNLLCHFDAGEILLVSNRQHRARTCVIKPQSKMSHSVRHDGTSVFLAMDGTLKTHQWWWVFKFWIFLCGFLHSHSLQ